MDLLIGLTVCQLGCLRSGTVIKSDVVWKEYRGIALWLTILWENNNITVEDFKNIKFSPEELNSIRDKVPEIREKLNRFEILDL